MNSAWYIRPELVWCSWCLRDTQGCWTWTGCCPTPATDTKQGWLEEHYLFRLLTHLLPLRDEHSHHWLLACSTFSKRKKETQFQSHKAEYVLLPSLALAALALPENTELFHSACGGAFKSRLQLPHFFSFFLERNKAVAALQLELQPKLLKPSILYIHTCLGLCSGLLFQPDCTFLICTSVLRNSMSLSLLTQILIEWIPITWET